MKTRNSEKWAWRISIGTLSVLAGMWLFLSRPAVQDRTMPDMSRHFVAASSDNFPPMTLLDDGGNLTGFARDLSTAAIRAVGAQVSYLHSPNRQLRLEWLATGRADFIHDAGYSKERDKVLDYSVPIIEMPEVIFVRSERWDITDFDTLKEKTVACVSNDITHLFLKQFKKIHLLVAETPVEALYELTAGKADALVYPKQVMLYLIQKLRLGDKIKITGKPLRILTRSMVVRKGDREILHLLNEGIARVKNSGEYDRIYGIWWGRRLLSGYSEREVRIIIAVSVGSTAALMLCAALVFFNRRLRKAKKILEAEICERRQIEEAKQESEARYCHIFEYSPLGIIHFDENGIINDCNAAFAEIIGAPRDRLIGFNMLKTMEDGPARSAIRDALKYGTGNFEGKYRTVSGNKKIVIRAVHKKIITPSGRFSGAVGIFEDITERRYAEDALRESHTRMNTVLDSISDGFFTLDNQLLVTYFNKAASRLLKRSAEEVLGRPLFEAFPEAAGSVFEEKFTWAAKEKKTLYLRLSSM